MRWKSTLWALALIVLPTGPACFGQERAQPVELAAAGKALLPVVVGNKASPRVRRSAQDLASYLGRISGGKFEVISGDGRSGIVVGATGDFPDLPLQLPGDAKDPTRSEDYLLRSHARGIWLIGRSELAVAHAVWDLLQRLGYRQFFPGPTWEVVPKRPDLRIAVNALEQPAYYSRRIWYGFGPWDYAEKPYVDWCAKNRATGGIVLRTGHAYDGILARNKAAFADHPEYLGLINGERRSTKFCISNPGLRRLVVADALNQLARDPAAQSVSLDPSDGGGWCECPQCKALGSVSDRALLLANEAAEAMQAKNPGRYVGMYAYSQHSPPPSIKVHPRVVISVATGFITGGYSVDQLLDGWQKQGATLGIREYYSVNTWDRDLPGAARGARPEYIQSTIPHFHAKGARFFSAEASDNWGPNGLGYYLASRILWDPREAKQIDALVSDFLEKAFGPAKAPMGEFYKLLNGPRRTLLSDDLVGRMYRLLAEARKRTDDAAIHKRLDDLVLYTRYVELWTNYASATGQVRQAAFEELIRHTYRMRATMLVHAKALYRDLAARDKSVTIPTEAAWNVPEGKNPWKSSAPFTRDELDGLTNQGIANRKLLEFEPVSFSTDLAPAVKLGLPDVAIGSMGLYSRGTHNYHTWVEKGPGTIALKGRGGLVYGNKGDAKLALYPAAEPEGKAVAQSSVSPDKQDHDITLKTAFQGLHLLEVSDSGAGTSLIWSDGTPMTVRSNPEAPATFHGRWSLYFYVPRGTKVVGGYASGPGILRDGGGKQVHVFAKKPGYFRVPVEPGQDGKLWKMENSIGQRLLMTVPPYLARNAKELLLPAEVIAKDAEK